MSRFLFLVSLLVTAPISADQWEPTDLSELVNTHPDREVSLNLQLRRIHRGAAVDELLDGYSLRVTLLRFKHVGSGGGQMSVPKYTSFSDFYMTANRQFVTERIHRAGINAESLPPCEMEDENSPVSDEHGIPAGDLREAACGLRINSLVVTGPAKVALDFLHSADPAVVQVTMEPTEYDIARMLWYTRPKVRSDEYIEAVRQRFPEFERADFPNLESNQSHNNGDR